jgi:hypothetical protein
MKQKAHYITLLFFSPVLQKLITTIQLHNIITNIQFDFILFLILIAIFSVTLLVAVIYFCIALVRWISSGFKLSKLWPCIISAIGIAGIYYIIKAIINTKIKRVQNRIQNIANALISRNTTLT